MVDATEGEVNTYNSGVSSAGYYGRGQEKGLDEARIVGTGAITKEAGEQDACEPENKESKGYGPDSIDVVKPVFDFFNDLFLIHVCFV